LRPAAIAVSLGLALACGPPAPDPLPRVVAAGPRGVVTPDARPEFTASEPLAAEGILDGRRLALCRAADLAAVKRLAGEAAGFGPGAPVLAARAALEDGGRRAVLEPLAPLLPGGYAAVLAPGVRAADGRPLLDAEGRQRAVVVEFEVAAPAGPPPRAALVALLADAGTPEAGGEYAVVLNLGAAPLDLAGFRLAKRGTTGAFTRCTLAQRAGAPVEAGAAALVAGGAYDGRYALPAGTPVYACGSSALLGGLANDRAPAVQLEDPSGQVLSSLGIAEPAPRCPGVAVERLDPEGPDAAANLACAADAAPRAFP
jgi:hypothetical protein